MHATADVHIVESTPFILFMYLLAAPFPLTFSSPYLRVSWIKPLSPGLTLFSPPPPLLLSVGSRGGLWNADSGTLGSLRGPAQCITSPPQDALSHSTPTISHFVPSLLLGLPAPSSVDMFAITPNSDWQFTSQAMNLSLLLNTTLKLISQVLLFVNNEVMLICLLLLMYPRVWFQSFQGFSNSWFLPCLFIEMIYAIKSLAAMK